MSSLTSESASPGGKRRRLRRAAKIAVLITAATLGLATGGAYLATEHLAAQVRRYPDVFSGRDEATRPQPTSSTTFLLVGSDSLSPEATTGSDAVDGVGTPGSQRSDVIMLLHIDSGYSTATVVSLPRDSWVPIPGRGMGKINAAFAYGGPRLLAETVEEYTKIRLDHVAVIDFAGFEAMIDAVGGIDLAVAGPSVAGTRTLRAGLNHLDGAAALAYVRERKNLPGGDLDRVRRHQNMIRALLTKVIDGGILADPARGYAFLDTLTRWISVDDTLDDNGLRGLVVRLRHLRVGNIPFLTAPVAGLGREGSQSVVHLDTARCEELWNSVNTEHVEGYLRKYPTSPLGGSTP